MTPARIAAPFPTYFGEFPDPATMALALRGIDVPTDDRRPLDRSLHSMLARGAVDHLNFTVARFGQAIPQTAVTENLHTFVFPTEPSIVRRISGQTLTGHQIFHFRPNEQTVAASPPGMPWAFGIITVPLGQLAVDGPDAIGLDPGVPLDDDRMFLAPEAALTRLIGLMKDAGRVVRDTPWIIAEPTPAKALAGSITDALLACLAQARARPDRAALRRHRQIVARFEAVVRERPEEMLSLSSICRAVGAAERTLNLACQEFLGQSAMQYAREHRLDLVRLTLLASDPARTQVTSIAMHYGFWELGRFAQVYRARFGERPSDTLRRDSGHLP